MIPNIDELMKLAEKSQIDLSKIEDRLQTIASSIGNTNIELNQIKLILRTFLKLLERYVEIDTSRDF